MSAASKGGPEIDHREVRICEASLAITQIMIDLKHISNDEFLVAMLRISPRLVKRPRKRKGR